MTENKRKHQRSNHETHLHFVGVGGIGMSGIAEVLLNQGYRVSGSDQVESETTERLKKIGLDLKIGHDPSHVEGAQVVVISSAVRHGNPEVRAARRLGIPVIPRAEMLGEIMRGKTGIAVGGSHGKTTTTSLLATILTQAELDPTIVIGGRVDSLGGNAKLGGSEFVVAEADESDGSFLHLPSTYNVITNIDNDHLDHFGSLDRLDQAFVDFVSKIPFYGVAALCGEDPGVQRCLKKMIKPFITFGFSKDWDFYATDLECGGKRSTFKVYFRESARDAHQLLGEFELSIPGKHNVLNALGAIVIATQLDVSHEQIAKALSEFKGVKRRFEVCWEHRTRNQIIVDDYGHHPTEISATLEAARNYWDGRIITVFQPHRFSRTLHCRDGFLSSFRKSDLVFVTDIYAAGEDPIEGVSSELLVEAMKAVSADGQQIRHSGSLEETLDEVLAEFGSGDMLLCLGAGTITRLPHRVIQSVQDRPAKTNSELHKNQSDTRQ